MPVSGPLYHKKKPCPKVFKSQKKARREPGKRSAVLYVQSLFSEHFGPRIEYCLA